MATKSKPRQRTITVDVKPGQTPPYVLTGDLTFDNDHHPGFFVYFKIRDDGGGYRFPNNKDLALAAKAGGSGCPAQGTTWPELVPRKVKDQNQTLRVRNFNTVPTKFSFTLFVTKSPSSPTGPFLPLDPVGTNNNGSYS